MRRRGGAAAAVLALLFAASLCGQEAPTVPPMPKVVRTPGKGKPEKPPIDFTGVWQLDEAASKNVSKQMEGAVLSVKQNGNRIWMEPSADSRTKILAEEIVVDGRLYEKSVGRHKGTLQASWDTTNQTLMLQVVTGTEENPQGAMQRMVWSLRDFGNTWVRRSWSIQPDGTKGSLLVFRKRAAGVAPSPTLSPRPKN